MPFEESILIDSKTIEKISKPFKEMYALNQFLNAALD
jgi:hypothetical protein